MALTDACRHRRVRCGAPNSPDRAGMVGLHLMLVAHSAGSRFAGPFADRGRGRGPVVRYAGSRRTRRASLAVVGHSRRRRELTSGRAPMAPSSAIDWLIAPDKTRGRREGSPQCGLLVDVPGAPAGEGGGSQGTAWLGGWTVLLSEATERRRGPWVLFAGPGLCPPRQLGPSSTRKAMDLSPVLRTRQGRGTGGM